ncbi:MAG TPA: TrbC/VirB2 family protein [Rhodanobacter sp.]
MAPNSSNDNVFQSSRTRLGMFLYLTIVLALVVPSIAFGQDATETIATTCGFASNISKILNAISIIVVTIAVIFSGYQIAFAHKRIGDVAPVLIGAILIGAAGQIARMLLTTSSGGGCPTTMIMHALNHYA